MEALQEPRGKLYAVFVDYSKAFDLLDRHVVVKKLGIMIGNDHYLTRIISEILELNKVVIYDNVTFSNPLSQTNGVLQGDPLSPILFTIATADVIDVVASSVQIYMYADDMVIAARNPRDLQESFNRLTKWAENNNLQINRGKTLQMVFRRGGEIAMNDNLYYGAEILTTANYFKYLGVTLQPTGRSFGIHVKDKAIAAI